MVACFGRSACSDFHKLCDCAVPVCVCVFEALLSNLLSTASWVQPFSLVCPPLCMNTAVLTRHPQSAATPAGSTVAASPAGKRPAEASESPAKKPKSEKAPKEKKVKEPKAAKQPKRKVPTVCPSSTLLASLFPFFVS